MADADYRLLYDILGNGRLLVTPQYRPKPDATMPLLPRVGMTLAVPRRYNQVRWYGRGPHSSYWDRKSGAEIALYSRTVEQMVFPCVRPQDNGNRTDTRWFSVSDQRGRGLRIVAAGEPLSFSTWPYALHDVEQADHDYELSRRPLNATFVDYKLHGVGSDNSRGRAHAPGVHPAGQPGLHTQVCDRAVAAGRSTAADPDHALPPAGRSP